MSAQNSSFGLSSLWSQSDAVIQGVALVLLLMSVLSWAVIVAKAWRLARLKRMARDAKDQFWYAADYEQGLARLGTEGTGRDGTNPYRGLAEAGRDAAERRHGSDLHADLNLSDWVGSCLRRSIADATNRLQSGMSLLASVGSTAPFIGLFGTVWGIYHALTALGGGSGAPGIDKVAGPVGEALVMTAFGLAVAIPAVLGFNALARGIRQQQMELSRFAHDLHAWFLTGRPLGSNGATRLEPLAPGER